MKNIAIICEYNLFHNGHLKQINKIREKFGECRIISLMSGNFVQRGEAALFPKDIRATTACLHGADLVLELPYPYSGGSAEYFAVGAIKILNKLHRIDELCFGSETDDLQYIYNAAENLTSEKFSAVLSENQRRYKSTNKSFNKLREETYKELFHENIVIKPNDILAVEYIKALKITNSKIKPFQIKRASEWSASAARKFLTEDNYAQLKSIVPDKAYEIYINESKKFLTQLKNIEKYILGYFRSCKPENLIYADVTDGIERRLINAAENAVTLEKFYNLCYNKKYSNSKIKRIILNCLLNTTEEMLKSDPLYTNALAFNDKGAEFLRNIKTGSEIAVITKPGHYKKHGEKIIGQYEHALKADKLYTLAMKNPEKANYFIKKKPYINYQSKGIKKMVNIKETDYKNFGKCVSISNELMEILVTTDVGPRIIKCNLLNRENLMFNDTERIFSQDVSGVFGKDSVWYIYGGHRMWVSPENMPLSYYPDNEKVAWTLINNGVILNPALQRVNNIRYEFKITMEPDKAEIRITHYLTNLNDKPIKGAIWALSVMDKNGVAVIPQPQDNTELLGNRILALWPYTDMSDTRVFWGNKYIAVKQIPGFDKKFKLGINNTSKWIAYINHNQSLVKIYEPNHPNGIYPDFGVSTEVFTNAEFLEAETLSELRDIEPNETIEHTEIWKLTDNISKPSFTNESLEAAAETFNF